VFLRRSMKFGDMRAVMRLFLFTHISADFHCCVEGLTENDGHEIDGHEIGGQDIYRLKIDYITMQCAILSKKTAEYKSQQRSKLYRPPVIVE